MPWLHGFVLGLPPSGGFWQESKWPWNMIHLIPCRNPCKLYIHLAFTYSDGPPSVVWSELIGSAFSTNESAWIAMVTGPQSHVWSGPEKAMRAISHNYFMGHHCCKFVLKKPVDVMIKKNHKFVWISIYSVGYYSRQILKNKISPYDEKKAWESNGSCTKSFLGCHYCNLVQGNQFMWWKERFLKIVWISIYSVGYFCRQILGGR